MARTLSAKNLPSSGTQAAPVRWVKPSLLETSPMTDEQIQELVAPILDAMRGMTEEERKEVFCLLRREFCEWCGGISDGRVCICMRDD